MGRVEIGRTTANEPIICEYSDKWSMKDFTNRKNIFAGRARELTGLTIYASCFYQETLDSDVFPSDVKGLILVHCNLDNVRIPAGVTVIANRPAKRIQVQNDLRDWEIDANNNPVCVCGEKAELIAGRSVNPADIPMTRLSDISELPSKYDYVNAFKAFEPEPSLDEKAVLETLMARQSVLASDKVLAQMIDDEINRLTAIKLKMESAAVVR